MFPSIQNLKDRSLRLWSETSSEFPDTDVRYSAGQQIQKEKNIDRLMQCMDDSTQVMKTSKDDKNGKSDEAKSQIQNSIIKLLHSFDCPIDDKMEKRFFKTTDDFIKRAYMFDPKISKEAVYQASRNVLIMNTFQMYLGKEITITPSVFAYSMLYPYTDNYVDAVEIDAGTKREANERLALRLMGISANGRNRHERTIHRLIEMIEREFDRNKYPDVFESLLAIHNAQCRSVLQQAGCDANSLDDLLDISVDKGGTSVFADGYLVAGDLSAEDAEFFFHFGVLLQLIDDLQDLKEDSLHSHRTLLGDAAKKEFLDHVTNRLFAFMAKMMRLVHPIRSHEQRQIRELIERSCRLLILEAIACNYHYYSDAYLHAIERTSPVRFEYLSRVQKRMKENSPAPEPGEKTDMLELLRGDSSLEAGRLGALRFQDACIQH